MAFRAVGAALRQVISHFSVMVAANVVGMVLSIPVLFLVSGLAYVLRSLSVIPLGAALLIGILPNPLMAGLQFVAHEYAHGEPVYLRDQWEGLRRYAPLALKAWLLSLPITTVVLLNSFFYANARFPLSWLLDIIWLYVLLTWLGAHLYVFPLLIEQEVKRVVLIYRNALLMALTRPLFTSVVLVFWLLFLLLFSATGLATIFGFAVGAAIQQNALVRILPTFEPSATN